MVTYIFYYMIYDDIACEYFESWACQYRKPVGTTVWSRHHHFQFSKIHTTRYKTTLCVKIKFLEKNYNFYTLTDLKNTVEYDD